MWSYKTPEVKEVRELKEVKDDSLSDIYIRLSLLRSEATDHFFHFFHSLLTPH